MADLRNTTAFRGIANILVVEICRAFLAPHLSTDDGIKDSERLA